MRVLLDQGLPRSAAGLLCDLGVDAIHTGQCGLATATDAHILAAAKSWSREQWFPSPRSEFESVGFPSGSE